MHKNRKIGLGVVATALTLGVMVAPTEMNATPNTQVPAIQQARTGETEEKTNTAPTIKLTGVADCILQAGDTMNYANFFVMKGATNPLGSLISAEDKEDGAIENNDIKFAWDKEVDFNAVGDYKVTLTVTDKDNNETSVFLTVKVVEDGMPAKGSDELVFGGQAIKEEEEENKEQVGEKPEIIFAEDLAKEIKVGEEFDATKGVTATDKEDGDLTDKIVIEGTLNNKVAGKYKLVYNVEDKDGNVTAVVRDIEVIGAKDGEVIGKAPVLEGVTEDLLVALNSEADYLKDVKATDEEDGDLTDKIDVDASNVDLAKEGNYEVIYRVSDADGNLTTSVRKVVVTAVGGLDENDKQDPNALPKTGAVAGVSLGGLGLAGIAGVILKRRK